MNSNDAIKLVPSEPPGRSSRKARRFAPEMRALRAQGYTFEAIRLALASSGVHVSNATVQREVARASKAASVGQKQLLYFRCGPSTAAKNSGGSS